MPQEENDVSGLSINTTASSVEEQPKKFPQKRLFRYKIVGFLAVLIVGVAYVLVQKNVLTPSQAKPITIPSTTPQQEDYHTQRTTLVTLPADFPIITDLSEIGADINTIYISPDGTSVRYPARDKRNVLWVVDALNKT